MVGAIHVHDCRHGQGAYVCVEQILATEGVARALEEEHRDRDVTQVLDAEFLRLGGRVQRIGVTHDALAGIAIGCEHRPYTSAHRPARQDQRWSELGSDAVGDRPVTPEEHLSPIGAALADLGVWIVERHHPELAMCQGFGGPHDHPVMLIGARPVSQQHGDIALTSNDSTHRPAFTENDLHATERRDSPDTLKTMQLTVFEDRKGMARHVADLIAERAERGPMTLGLAGGSTPADTYRQLATHQIDWSKIWLWLSDERWVPHDHADSNGRMALEHLPEEAGQRLVRPRHSPYLQPEDSAAHYEAELRLIHDGRSPDMVLVGMGTDGHTASLFPGTDALDAPSDRWFVANHVPQLDAWRLTVTPALLRRAAAVVVLVAGDDKAEVLQEVLEGPDGGYPIQLLRQAEGTVTFVGDRSATSLLSA